MPLKQVKAIMNLSFKQVISCSLCCVDFIISLSSINDDNNSNGLSWNSHKSCYAMKKKESFLDFSFFREITNKAVER